MNIDVNFISNINRFIEEQLSFKRTIDSTKESINELNKEMTSKVSGAGFAKNLAEDIEIARLKLNRLSSELKKLYAQRREGATPSPQWTNEMEKLKAKTATARAELAKLNKEFKEFNAVPKEGGGSNFIQSWGKYLLRYYVAFQGIQMAMQGISNAYNTLKDFEYAMAGVKAVSGATASEFENLKQKAIALSGTTLFNAVDIAKLEEVYSKAGFTIKQIAAMIEPTLKTATATDDSLENTSELLGGIINGFKLNADNTKHIADVMGLAFNKSMLDLSKFKESMKYVGNIAAEAGFSFEEVSAILMVASNNMMSGSMAGTALRQVFNSMLNPTSKFSKAIGGTVYGLEGFMNALKGLKEKGADLGTMFQITDKRAANLFNIMMNNTDQLKLFTEQAKNANGEMDKMAAIKLDTITGKTKELNGEWQKFLLNLDNKDGRLSGFLKLVLDTASKGVKFLEMWNNPLKYGTDEAQKYLDEENEKRIQSISANATAIINSTGEQHRILMDTFSKNYTQARNKYLEAISGKGNLQTARADLLYYLSLWDEISKKQTSPTKQKPKELTDEQKKELVKQLKDQGEYNKALIEEEQIKNNKLLEQQNQRIEEQKNIGKKSYEEQLSEAKEYGNKLILSNQEINQQEYLSEYNDKLNLIERLHYLDQKSKGQELEQVKSDYEYKNKLDKSAYNTAVEIAQKNNESTKVLDENYKRDRLKSDEDYFAKKNDINNKYLNIDYKIPSISESLKKQLDDENKDIGKVFEDEGERLQQLWANNVKDIIAKNKEKKEISFIGNLLGLDKEGDSEMTSLLNDFTSKFNSYVDQWVEGYQKVVDAKNRMVDEAQSALDTEIELNKQGFATNVGLKQKELADLKAKRDAALEDQRQAYKAQMALEVAMQIATTTTALVRLIGEEIKNKGILGLVTGAAGIVSLFAIIQSYKSKAASTFERGGMGVLQGKSHAEGGISFGDGLEAQGGESWAIFNRNATNKNLPLIKNMVYTINNDKIVINKDVATKLGDTTVVYDSPYMKRIYDYISANKTESKIEYGDGFRIEHFGNHTKKIFYN